MIDSQSVKTTEAGGSHGFDTGKKINDRKRHIITDTLGHLVGLDVHSADIQDRDGAVRVIKAIRTLYPWLRHLFAMADTPAQNSKRGYPKSATGSFRSSNAQTTPQGLSF